MMTLRHDDMMERSPLPPQAGNTRFSYNDRGAHWESSGRRNEKMTSNPQLSPSMSFLRVHVLSLLNYHIN